MWITLRRNLFFFCFLDVGLHSTAYRASENFCSDANVEIFIYQNNDGGRVTIWRQVAPFWACSPAFLSQRRSGFCPLPNERCLRQYIHIFLKGTPLNGIFSVQFRIESESYQHPTYQSSFKELIQIQALRYQPRPWSAYVTPGLEARVLIYLSISNKVSLPCLFPKFSPFSPLPSYSSSPPRQPPRLT